MWMVYYADGSTVSSEEKHWSEISRRVFVRQSTAGAQLLNIALLTPQDAHAAIFDILQRPAIEMRMRPMISTTWHVLKACRPEGENYFHYERVRTNLGNGNSTILYEAIGYFYDQGRIVLEVAPGMSVTRMERGPVTFG